MRKYKAYRLKVELSVASLVPAPNIIHFYKNELVEGEVSKDGNDLIVRNNDVEEKNDLKLPMVDLEEQSYSILIGKMGRKYNSKEAAINMLETEYKPTIKVLYKQYPEIVATWFKELMKELDINYILKKDREKLQGSLDLANSHIPFKADNIEVGGQHYQKPIQPWDYIYANGLDFDSGNVVKYISRYKEKNGAEDVKKAISYCKHILKTQYNDDGEV